MLEVLFICTGNVCRSPLAEQVLASRLRDTEVTVRSAGTRARAGMVMPPLSIRMAVDRGVESEVARNHVARPLSELDISRSDLIIAMERQHRRDVVELVPAAVRKVFLASEFTVLAACYSDLGLIDTSDSAGAERTSQDRLRSSLDVLSAGRGLVPGWDANSTSDIVDPYGRSLSTFERSAAQVDETLRAVERVLRVSLH